MKETENTRSWEETKVVAKRLMLEQLGGCLHSEHELGVVRLSVYAPLPMDARASSLADRLEASVRRRIEKIPDSELMLMDEAISFLRALPANRKKFVGRVAGEYERHCEYWKSRSMYHGDMISEMSKSDTEWIIKKLMESYGHKG